MARTTTIRVRHRRVSGCLAVALILAGPKPRPSAPIRTTAPFQTGSCHKGMKTSYYFGLYYAACGKALTYALYLVGHFSPPGCQAGGPGKSVAVSPPMIPSAASPLALHPAGRSRSDASTEGKGGGRAICNLLHRTSSTRRRCWTPIHLASPLAHGDCPGISCRDCSPTAARSLRLSNVRRSSAQPRQAREGSPSPAVASGPALLRFDMGR